VGALFKVCPTYLEARIYLEVHQGRGQPPPLPKRDPYRTSIGGGGTTTLPVPLTGERMNFYKQACWIKGGGSVIGDQSKVKEGKIFGLSVLDTFKLRNGLVPDPERLPEVLHFFLTEQLADFASCPWSEGHGGDLDGEHSDILTHALTTLVGKQNDETFGGTNMDTTSEEDHSWVCKNL
jgi:hypothetical protein